MALESAAVALVVALGLTDRDIVPVPDGFRTQWGKPGGPLLTHVSSTSENYAEYLEYKDVGREIGVEIVKRGNDIKVSVSGRVGKPDVLILARALALVQPWKEQEGGGTGDQE